MVKLANRRTGRVTLLPLVLPFGERVNTTSGTRLIHKGLYEATLAQSGSPRHVKRMCKRFRMSATWIKGSRQRRTTGSFLRCRYEEREPLRRDRGNAEKVAEITIEYARTKNKAGVIRARYLARHLLDMLPFGRPPHLSDWSQKETGEAPRSDPADEPPTKH